LSTGEPGIGETEIGEPGVGESVIGETGIGEPGIGESGSGLLELGTANMKSAKREDIRHFGNPLGLRHHYYVIENK
jgi:hypothetical protein